MPTHPAVDLFPFTSDADADLVFPFTNRALREMHPRRPPLTTEEFRVRFARAQMERHFFGLMDGDGQLAALGLAMWWVDGTNEHLVFLQNLVQAYLDRDDLTYALTLALLVLWHWSS